MSNLVRGRRATLISIAAAVATVAGAQAQSPSTVPAPSAVPIPDSVRAACSAAAGPNLQRIVDSGTLKVSTGIAAPWGYRDTGSNELIGFEPESAAELAGILGVGLDIKDYDYGLLVANLQSGESDIVMAGLFVTDARKEAADFSDVLTKSGQLMYTLSDSPINTVEDANAPTVTFVYGTGNAQGDLAKELIPNATIIDAPLQGQNLLYEFLTSGNADITMSDSLLNPIFKARYPDLKVIGAKGVVTSDFPADDEVLQPFDVAYAVAKDQPDLLGCVNTYVGWLKSTGGFEARFTKWMNAAIEANQ